MVRTDWFEVTKQLSLNALFWVGIVAIVLTLVSSQDTTFLAIFIGLVLFNAILLLLLKTVAPSIFNQLPITHSAENKAEAEGKIGFRVYPLEYPKVLDEDLKDYAPEFIHLDIAKGNSVLFGGNIARSALKQFRDMLNKVLKITDIVPANNSKAKPRHSPKRAKTVKQA
ncbi:MAG: hypothetical protein ACE5DI_05670 [Candidatus Micrarchaeia archaeon]